MAQTSVVVSTPASRAESAGVLSSNLILPNDLLWVHHVEGVEQSGSPRGTEGGLLREVVNVPAILFGCAVGRYQKYVVDPQERGEQYCNTNESTS